MRGLRARTTACCNVLLHYTAIMQLRTNAESSLYRASFPLTLTPNSTTVGSFPSHHRRSIAPLRGTPFFRYRKIYIFTIFSSSLTFFYNWQRYRSKCTCNVFTKHLSLGRFVRLERLPSIGCVSVRKAMLLLDRYRFPNTSFNFYTVCHVFTRASISTNFHSQCTCTSFVFRDRYKLLFVE